MLFSFKWLNDFVPFSHSPEELATLLTLAGHEVEGISYIGEKLEGIIVGRIDDIVPHPNADKLVITSVFDGSKHHQIVTGATNISKGDLVPLSLPGSVLANGVKIKETKLRGIDSFGMLCSEEELGVSVAASGIWILPAETPLGCDFIEYAYLKDAILDVSILPNRGDIGSVYGLAREISALLNLRLKTVPTNYLVSGKISSHTVLVESPSLCPLYLGRFIKNFSDTPSPLWMKRRLELMGIRSVSLAVDITNYVLLELGQPFHAFDLTSLSSSTIRICNATEKTPFQTLDSENRLLSSEDLIVCDDTRPIALAGIMGGLSSEVSATTETLFIEAAFFDPVSVRRSSARHGLRTESSTRFERTLDIGRVSFAMDRLLHLFHSLSGSTILETSSSFKNPLYKGFSNTVLPLDPLNINKILGTSYSETQVKKVLESLGFSLKGDSVTVPSWRHHDVRSMACLAEEVSRLIGFDSIPSTQPDVMSIPDSEQPLSKLRHSLDTFFILNGFSQINTFPLISKEYLSLCHQSLDVPVVENPISSEESCMRSSMIPSLLKVAQYNRVRQQSNIRIVESGNVFSMSGSHYSQRCITAGIFMGNRWDHAYMKDDVDHLSPSFFYFKGLIENALSFIGVSFISQSEPSPDMYHPRQFIAFYSGHYCIAKLGLLHPLVCHSFDLNGPVFAFEFDTERLSQISGKTPTYTPIPKFPSTRRDIAFLVPKSLSFKDIDSVISKYKPKLVVDFYVFDVFESETIGSENKSIGVAFTYQDNAKTLSDEKVNKTHASFTKLLLQNLPISIR
jgi:phenylalanyl-tRNA synthetase beta chain